jgi:hypothetical protein
MATQPHHDDDQGKKPDDAHKSPKTPTPKKPPVPDMELDKPEEALFVDEVIEEEAIPVLESADEEPLVLADSDVIAAEEVEEVVEAQPASEVVLANEALAPHPTDSPPVLSQPPTGVRTGPATPLPSVEVTVSSEMAPKPAPTSDVDLVQMFDEPTGAVHAEPPVSDVVAAEEVIEEAAPVSDVVAAEEVIEEAAPVSDVVAAEEVIEEATPASAVQASTDDYIEAVEEPSSATRKAEAVLADEVVEAEEVLDAEEAEAVATGSSAVLFDDLAEAESGAKKPGTKEYQAASSGKKRTIPFESPSSDVKKTGDELVTEEELVGSAEASAVDLGDMPAHKGSSVTGIDKVAEALESGVDLDAEEAAPLDAREASVVFDEALEDLGDSDEGAIELPKGKKAAARNMEGSTDMDQEALENMGSVDEPLVGKKKGKKSGPASDEVDLESLFDEDDAESAQPIEEAADFDATVAFDSTSSEDVLKKGSSAEVADEAESAAIFDEETEAAEALDEESVDLGAPPEEDSPIGKKGKGKKKAALVDEDAEAAEAMAEDDSSSRKKKGKKKELAAVAPAEARRGTLVPWLGGIFVGGLLMAGAAGAAVFFAPEQIEGLVKTTPEKKSADPAIAAKAKEAADLADKLKKATDANALTEKDLKKAMADNEKIINEIKALEDVFAKGKFISAPGAFDAGALDKTLKDLSKDKSVLDTINNLLKDAEVKDVGDKGVKTILENRKDAEDKLAAASKVVDAVNKLLKDAEVKDAGDKGVKAVLESKKDTEDKLTAVNKVLEDEKIKDQGAKGVLMVVEERNKTAKDRDDLFASIKAAFKEFVDGKIVPAGADPRKQLVEGAKMARQRAESPLAIPVIQLGQQLAGIGSGTGKFVEKSFDVARLATELGFYKTREPLIQSPQQKMDTDIALLLDRKRNNPKALAAITREADWVLTPESKSSAEARGKARYVQGLALRNLEKYDEARAAFADALKVAPAGAWTDSVKKSMLELTDPNAYYIPRIVGHGAVGNLKSALAETDTAIKVMPAEARLFAIRGLIRVELIRGQGAKVSAEDQKAIRADAASAAKLAAESAYIVGLLEEELGNWSEAEKLYRDALKAHQGGDDEAGKYRVALARLLLRDRAEGAAPAAPPAPAEEKKDAAAPIPVERTIVVHPWSLLIVSAVIAQAGEDETEDPATVARLKETVDLANQLIASKTDKIKGQGYLILGSALSRQGKRTEGIKEYAKGLKLLYPGIESTELAKLIAEHPAFQQPDSGGNDPILAERHFGEGYHLFWAGKYADAEAQFKKAVGLFDKDARFQYFLGLAQYHQKTKAKRDAAYFAWEQGARLEAKAATNPFAVREINASLERVQGNERQLLNSYRYKAAEEAEVK